MPSLTQREEKVDSGVQTKMEDVNISYVQNMDFGRGTFQWDEETQDFYKIQNLGQKEPLKSIPFHFTYEEGDLRLEGKCDYNTARIIQILMDKFDELHESTQDYWEE